jgi:hypothetical protein
MKYIALGINFFTGKKDSKGTFKKNSLEGNKGIGVNSARPAF